MTTRALGPALAGAAALLGLGLCSAQAEEGKLMIYPAQGQSAKQLSDDRFACYLQAVAQSGFDPANPPPASAHGPIKVEVPKNPKQGAVGKGAAAGALAGAAIGNNNHDTLGGAVAGAIVGSAIGSVIEAQGQDDAREQATAEAKQKAAARADERAKQADSRAQYRAVMQACMEGRGYTVR